MVLYFCSQSNRLSDHGPLFLEFNSKIKFGDHPTSEQS